MEVFPMNKYISKNKYWKYPDGCIFKKKCLINADRNEPHVQNSQHNMKEYGYLQLTLSMSIGSACIRRTIHSNKFLNDGASSDDFSLNFNVTTFSFSVKLWKAKVIFMKSNNNRKNQDINAIKLQTLIRKCETYFY